MSLSFTLAAGITELKGSDLGASTLKLSVHFWEILWTTGGNGWEEGAGLEAGKPRPGRRLLSQFRQELAIPR